MDFELDEDQLELQGVVRDVVRRECPPALVRAVVAGDDDGADLWKTLVQLDWPSLTVPAADGGMGASTVELVITLEELGRHADPTPFLATTSQYVPVVRNCAGDGDVRRDLLAAVCAGGTGAVAFTDNAEDTVTARRDAATGRWRLAGTAHHVLDGDRADRIAIVARIEAIGGPDTTGGPDTGGITPGASRTGGVVALADLPDPGDPTSDDDSGTAGGIAAGKSGTGDVVALANGPDPGDPTSGGDTGTAGSVAAGASGAGGVVVAIVPAAAVSARRTPSFDRTLHVADVDCDGVEVDDDRVFQGPDVERGLARAQDEAVTGMAATTVGAAQHVLDLAVAHVKERHQFGLPIGSFQAVKHMAVDVHVAIERARALCHFAALALAEDDEQASLAASMAKAAAGDAQRIAFRHGVQLFGGLGFTWENDLQLYLRRAKSGELLLGGTAHHRARVARLVLAAQAATTATAPAPPRAGATPEAATAATPGPATTDPAPAAPGAAAEEDSR